MNNSLLGLLPREFQDVKKNKIPYCPQKQANLRFFRILKQVNQEPLQGQLDFDPSNSSTQCSWWIKSNCGPCRNRSSSSTTGRATHTPRPAQKSATWPASIPRSSSHRHQWLHLRTSDSSLCWLKFGKCSSLNNKAGGLSIPRNLPTEHFTRNHLLAGYLIL